MGKRRSAGLTLFLISATLLAKAQASNPVPQADAQPSTNQAQPVGTDHARAYYHFMLARRYRELAGIYNRSDLGDRAISEYKQAMEADPESLFLRVELAELYWRVNRVDDAVREADAVLKANPDQIEAHRLLARIYFQSLGENQNDKTSSESLKKAIQHFEALTRLDPKDTDSYVLLGRLYRAANQPAKAEEAFKRILNGDPSSKSALANLAQLYSEQGDYQLAIDFLGKIPQEEMDAQLLGMLAYAYTQAHNFDDAVSTYEKAIALDPQNLDLKRNYAEALVASGKTVEARDQLQQVLKLEPQDANTYLRLAQLDLREGKFDEARQDLQHAKALAPESLEVSYQQAILEDAVGNSDQAVQILQGLVKQSERPDGKYTPAEANNRAIFLERLGSVYQTQEKYDQAIETFRQILMLGKAQGPHGEALIVQTLRLNRQPEKALAEAAAAIQKYPDDRQLKLVHASLLGEQGRVDEAIKELTAMLNKTAGDRDVYGATAQVYSQAKRYPEAEAAIKKVMAENPKPEDEEFASFMLGSIYEREKKFDLAEEQFKKVLSSNPLNAPAANYLGYMLADRGVRLEESVKYIQKALALEPNNGAYLDSLGWAYYKMNRPDLAAPPLEKAAHLITNDPTIHRHLGDVYLQMGKKELAEKEWERALQEWPGSPGSDFDADEAAKLRKQLDDLKVTLSRAVK